MYIISRQPAVIRPAVVKKLLLLVVEQLHPICEVAADILLEGRGGKGAGTCTDARGNVCTMSGYTYTSVHTVSAHVKKCLG